MLIVAIAWLYVVILMALAETSVTAGLATFVLYGAGPLAIVLWLLGTPERRRRLRAASADGGGAPPPPLTPAADDARSARPSGRSADRADGSSSSPDR